MKIVSDEMGTEIFLEKIKLNTICVAKKWFLSTKKMMCPYYLSLSLIVP